MILPWNMETKYYICCCSSLNQYVCDCSLYTSFACGKIYSSQLWNVAWLPSNRFLFFWKPNSAGHLNYQYTWNFTRSSSHDKLYPPCHITKIQIFTFVDLADTFYQFTFFGNQTNELGIASYALLFFIMCDSVTGNIWKLFTLLKCIQYHRFVFKKNCKENIYWSQ